MPSSLTLYPDVAEETKPDAKPAVGIRARLMLLALLTVVPLMIERVHVLEATRHERAENASIRALLAQPNGTIAMRSDDGSSRVYSFIRLPESVVHAATPIDDREIADTIDREIRLAYLQLALFGLLALGAAWISGERLIVRPIRALAAAAASIGKGELQSQPLQGQWASEFAPLVDALTDMTKKLREREEALRTANRHLEMLASLDSLSGVPNRRMFDTRLASEWRIAATFRREIGLLMIDVDHFKAFNDSYGHLEGDRCLRALAEALAKAARANAAFIARYGGEEFVVLLAGGESACIALAEWIRRDIVALDLPHRSVPSGRVTVSIGVAALVPPDDATPLTLIAAADAGLYRAKACGRNRTCLGGPGLMAAAS